MPSAPISNAPAIHCLPDLHLYAVARLLERFATRIRMQMHVRQFPRATDEYIHQIGPVHVKIRKAVRVLPPQRRARSPK